VTGMWARFRLPAERGTQPLALAINSLFGLLPWVSAGVKEVRSSYKVVQGHGE
jgi:hypothetical protein